LRTGSITAPVGLAPNAVSRRTPALVWAGLGKRMTRKAPQEIRSCGTPSPAWPSFVGGEPSRRPNGGKPRPEAGLPQRSPLKQRRSHHLRSFRAAPGHARGEPLGNWTCRMARQPGRPCSRRRRFRQHPGLDQPKSLNRIENASNPAGILGLYGDFSPEKPVASECHTTPRRAMTAAVTAPSGAWRPHSGHEKGPLTLFFA